MGQHVLPGNPPVELVLRRSSRARRISLRVSRLDGRVTLTMPLGVAEREALMFAREKAGWLRDQLADQPNQVRVGVGTVVPVEGTHRRIYTGPGRQVRAENDALLVPGSADAVGARVQAWLKAHARDRLVTMSDRYAGQLGQTYKRISLRDTRSRWGSCSAEGGLMYSWRLIMAPPDVLDYVAAHEVAHLAEMNHSSAFWAVVEQLKPAYDAPRQWLRDNGAGLHGYRFKD